MTIELVAKKEWKLLRDAVAADDTALTTFEYDNAVYAAGKVDIPKESNAVAIAFFGTDAENEDATVIVYGRARSNGPIMELYAGEVQLGAKVVTKHPITKAVTTAFWGDLITSTGQEWITDVSLRNETADDSIGYVVLNLFGIQDIYVEIDLDGVNVFRSHPQRSGHVVADYSTGEKNFTHKKITKACRL